MCMPARMRPAVSDALPEPEAVVTQSPTAHATARITTNTPTSPSGDPNSFDPRPLPLQPGAGGGALERRGTPHAGHMVSASLAEQYGQDSQSFGMARPRQVTVSIGSVAHQSVPRLVA